MGVKRNKLSGKLICFALVGLSCMASPSPLLAENEETLAVSLVESWPAQDVTIWVPSREGKLVFSGPVNPSTAEYDLVKVNDASAGIFVIERVAYGVSADTVLFKLPELTSGTFEINWAIQTAAKEDLKGTINFSVAPKLVAPGGANHRMDGTSIVPESRTNFLFKMGILSVLALLAALRRYRHVSLRQQTKEDTKEDTKGTLVNVASGGMVSLLGGLGFLSTLYASLERQKHVDALEHYILAFTAPLLWVYAASFVLGVYYATSRSSLSPLAGSVLLSFFFASAYSSDFSSVAYVGFAVNALLLVSFSFLAYHTYQLAASALLRKTSYPDMFKLLYWFLCLAAFSVARVYVQANFHALVGFHTENVKLRLDLSAVGAALLLVLCLTNRILLKDSKKSILRFVLPLPVVAMALALLVVGLSLAAAPSVVPGL